MDAEQWVWTMLGIVLLVMLIVPAVYAFDQYDRQMRAFYEELRKR